MPAGQAPPSAAGSEQRAASDAEGDTAAAAAADEGKGKGKKLRAMRRTHAPVIDPVSDLQIRWGFTLRRIQASAARPVTQATASNVQPAQQLVLTALSESHAQAVFALLADPLMAHPIPTCASPRLLRCT
jgi:hypothetical protein